MTIPDTELVKYIS